MSVNVQIVGRLGGDSEIKTGKNGGQFVTFRLATDEYKGGKNETAWLNVVDYNEKTLKMAQYLKKGTMVNVHGVETVDVYQNRNGEFVPSRDIRAYSVDFVNSGQSGMTSSSDAQQVTKPQVNEGVDCGKLTPPKTSNQTIQAVDDDLPF